MPPYRTVEIIDTLNWGFGNQPPHAHIPFKEFEDAYGYAEACDPCPCYHHNFNLVQNELDNLCEICPLPIPIKIGILTYEPVGRNNGCYHDGTVYKDDDKLNYGIIMLAGKRIPPHPAMTRYLVSHEYGHAVTYCLERAMGIENFRSLYQEQFRPKTDYNGSYGPGTWHNAVGELIANDFRILIAHREEEFWPHQGHERPENVPRLYEFWCTVQQVFHHIVNGTEYLKDWEYA